MLREVEGERELSEFVLEVQEERASRLGELQGQLCVSALAIGMLGKRKRKEREQRELEVRTKQRELQHSETEHASG